MRPIELKILWISLINVLLFRYFVVTLLLFIFNHLSSLFSCPTVYFFPPMRWPTLDCQILEATVARQSTSLPTPGVNYWQKAKWIHAFMLFMSILSRSKAMKRCFRNVKPGKKQIFPQPPVVCRCKTQASFCCCPSAARVLRGGIACCIPQVVTTGWALADFLSSQTRLALFLWHLVTRHFHPANCCCSLSISC